MARLADEPECKRTTDLFLTVRPPVSHFLLSAMPVAFLSMGFLLTVRWLRRHIFFAWRQRLRRRLVLSILHDEPDTMVARLALLSAGPSQVRVGRMVRRLSTLAGLDAYETDRLVAAIPLYDVGMISVSEVIQRKSGPLDELELAVLHRHPGVGVRLLRGTRSAHIDFAAELALCHHELWNGEGYPQKLVAEQIPIAARIVAIAEAFDGLLSELGHGPAWSLENAVHHIVVEAGRRYDPVLAQMFLDDLPMMLALRSPADDQDAHGHGADQPMHRTESPRVPLVWPVALAEGLRAVHARIAQTPCSSTDG